MKKTTKMWVMLVALIFLLTACSQSENNVADSSNQPDSSNTENNTETNESGNRERIELNWFVTAPSNTNLPNKEDDFVLQTIEEMFNVELKVDYMQGGQDYVNRTNLLLASTPPDMWRDSTPDGGNQYALDGLLADMTPFVSPETMPNYFEHWTTVDEVEAYQVQNQFLRSPVPFNRNIYRTYYVREDWLNNLGLDVPTNYDEYVDVLRAFRNDDPDQNGTKDTYGFTVAGGGSSITLDWPEYIKNGLTFPRKIENRYVDMQTHEDIEYVLNDIVAVIEEDLIDPDWFLNQNPQHIEKAIQGRVGVVMGSQFDFALDGNPQGLQVRTQQLFPEANWVPMNIFPDTPMAVKPGPGGPFLFAKKIADENPEKIERSIEILDWLASEEGFLMTHYGLEDVHYTRNGNTIERDIETYTTDVIEQGDFLGIWKFFTPEAPHIFDLEVIDPRQTDRDREIIAFFNTINLLDNEGVSYIPPEGFDLATFRSRQAELQVQAIMDDQSGDRWPEYREELMTTYDGNALFEAYDQTLRDAGIID